MGLWSRLGCGGRGDAPGETHSPNAQMGAGPGVVKRTPCRENGRFPWGTGLVRDDHSTSTTGGRLTAGLPRAVSQRPGLRKVTELAPGGSGMAGPLELAPGLPSQCSASRCTPMHLPQLALHLPDSDSLSPRAKGQGEWSSA